ncbi:MAG: ATP-binding cassette domain-containing protein [Deltaproteobacteria bacterium]|nr:MAG: ATP-binding cassette domain-containing protein [Deltaproteobacteria bacterium]
MRDQDRAMTRTTTRDDGGAPAVDVCGLSFRYGPGGELALRDATLAVQPGWRVLIVGANGAGKTTLLRVVAGKHMVDAEAVRVLGRPAFDDTSLADEVELLGGPFAFREDVRVGALVDGVLGVDPDRRDRLIRVLGVDVDWRMHRVSDGQRRRVQVLLGLLRPSRVLLLDEVTTDLDVVARYDLLAFLREESERHGTAILYATHIFDGLEAWATHLAYVRAGRVARFAPMESIDELRAARAAGTPAPLVGVVLDWLRAE